MASIAIRHLVLEDKIPGPVQAHLGLPQGGLDGTYSNCVTSPVYPLGTKIQKFNDFSEWRGYTTFVYGAWHDGTDLGTQIEGDPSRGFAIAAHACGTCTGDGSTPGPYMFTNDMTNSDMTDGMGVVIPLRDMSTADTTGLNNATYGWFWCGGVCPNQCITKWQTVGYITATVTDLKNPVQIYECGTQESAIYTGDISQSVGRVLVASA